mmetsp:Transcript_63305/g.103846  ORF Transcript_63305/g.103846 Transcript_63305/m.103846 type:complete len:168 (-) Transcript_63305:2-505(-)
MADLMEFTAPKLLGPRKGTERMYAVASQQALLRRGPSREHMGTGFLRFGMRFLAIPEAGWLRLCPQSIRPPLASPSAAGLEVEHENLWVEATEPTIRPVLEDQRCFSPGDQVEVIVGEPGPRLGEWLPCQIQSPGDWPGTYHIFVENHERNNIPMWYFRTPGDDDWA